MTAMGLLREQAQLAYADLLEAIDGVEQPQAWAVLPNLGPDYIHSDGSIQGIVLHIATGKVIYGSVGFRNTERRWRDIAAELDAFEPDWGRAKTFLEDAHRYWMSTWENLTDADLEREVPRFNGELWPVWKILRMVIYHDGYHAGQIALLRYGVTESPTPPPSQAEDIRTYCKDMPSW